MRADAAKNVRALTAAAKELFDEQGPDVPLDEVARRAGVGNATLYRYFPTRADLMVGVYADEVADLCMDGAALLMAAAPGQALFAWLNRFVVHVATKRALALAGTEHNGERRTKLFDTWHEAMRTVATDLYDEARRAGTVSPQVSAEELLAMASAAALAGNGPQEARRLLTMMWYGVAGDAAV
ncbi:AcrR family transcriptional regulator [Catenulispora sp. MAP12-49]|jgi:AcrR family transcriptional regulator|uniref:TetR/AcrR family transcriptional regulator n=1 Tax=unclassified Catenulispora TaxID=414885 RepID=UPI003513C8D0